MFDTMRQRHVADLTGVIDGSERVGDLGDVTARVADAGDTAWRSLQPATTSSTEPWSDLQTRTSSRALYYAYERTVAMATALRTPGSALTGDPDLLVATIGVAEWLNTYRYNTTVAKDSDWWFWEIGIPMEVNDLTSLLYDDLSAAQRTRYLDAVARFTPTPKRTSANLVWGAYVVALRGVLAEQPAKIAEAVAAVRPALLDATTGDGFRPDGSLVSHERFAYTGGYGLSLLEIMSKLYHLVDGTQWESTDAAFLGFYDRVERSYGPAVWCGDLLADVRGREIARAGSTDGSGGVRALGAALRLADTAPADARRAVLSRAKQWAECSADSPAGVEAAGTRSDVVRARLLLADDTVAAATAGTGGSVALNGVDRFVSATEAFGFSVSMSSSRIGGFESINGENLNGWYTGSGMTSLRLGGGGQFDGGYWATANPYRVPGTTEDTMRRASAEGSRYASAETFAGSLATPDRAAGIAAMQYDAYRSNLSADKTWFAFDDEIVCVGVGIRSSAMSGYGWDGLPTRVETVIDNRRALDAATTVVVGGTAVAAGASVTKTTAWAAISGPGESVGYYFPSATSVTAQDETRSGTWAAINRETGTAQTVSARYLTLVTSHGRNPAGAAYQYVILPGATPAAAEAYSRDPGISTLERAAGHVAIYDRSSTTLGAVSFDGATDHPIAVDGMPLATWRGAGILAIQETAASFVVSVADPSRGAGGRIIVRLQRPVELPPLGDGLVRAQPTADGTELEFDPSGGDGATRSVTLTKISTPVFERIDDKDPRVVYAAEWKTTSSPEDHGGSIRYTSAGGASLSLTFTGSRISVETRLTTTAGINEVVIDGVVMGRFDGYAATPTYRQTVYRSPLLGPGEHTITVRRTGLNSAGSSGRNIILDSLLIERPPP
ncbi:polysaccharide lyase family 8 super-sandwich domain-containing protein [Microbacterium sp. SS28]|uniref:polysaccharide lyase family 8 super-sandwich domain-containing protein n=1 Tax=Microbacterium sp. SS28 TaxID=2919948 RepID=UPI001FA9B7E7|nr:polysaccharide lyase family 8 super-sandwich domain-containing protein [Microbacterium sp. SS28]